MSGHISFIIGTILLLFSFSVLADSLPTEDAGDYTHSGGQCLRCHENKQELQAILFSKMGTCNQCHGAENSQGSHQGAELIAVQSNEPASDEPVSVTVGMRYAQYPLGSRLGDAPNSMVLIPAGTFIKGSDDRLPDEGPQHSVELNSYYIDRYEVTNLQYRKFNTATQRRSPAHWRNRSFPQGKADHPVTNVSWTDAAAYCQWAGKRLPTDSEWEKAARGSDGRTYPWGNQFDIARANTPLRWSAIGIYGDTTPVGAFESGVSPFGVYDMSGNVWEWTASWYQPYPGNTHASESYGERYKILKGGSWFDCSFYRCGISAPTFNRAFFSKKVKNDSFGFRCAKDA